MSLTPTSRLPTNLSGGSMVVSGQSVNVSGTLATAICGKSAIKMNTNVLSNEIRCAPTNVINSTMAAPGIQFGVPTSASSIVSNNTAGQQLIHVIPLTMQSTLPQSATILTKNKINQAIPTTTVGPKLQMPHDLPHIAQIIGAAMPIQVAGVGVTPVTTKSAQTLTVVQGIPPAISATNPTIRLQNPLQQQKPITSSNLQIISTTTPTLQPISTTGTFSMITPIVNSKTQTSEFVLYNGSPKPAITLNATAIPAKTKIVEIKCMDKILRQPSSTLTSTTTTSTSIIETSKNQNKQMPTAIATTTATLLPKQTAITPIAIDKMQSQPIGFAARMITPYTGIRALNTVTSKTTANDASLQKPHLNELNLDKLLPETTITKEPITTIDNMSSVTSPIVVTNTITAQINTEPTESSKALQISKVETLCDDLDNTENMLIIDDSTDADDSDIENNEHDSNIENNSTKVLTESPIRVRHISNSVVLTKASAIDVRANGGLRNMSPEPANVVLMKLPNAAQQNSGMKPQNITIPINEALIFTKESLRNKQGQTPEQRPITMMRSNSTPETQRTLSPRAAKRSKSLNFGPPEKLCDVVFEKLQVQQQNVDEKLSIEKEGMIDSNDSSINEDKNNSNAEITFIELEDSFDEASTDDDDLLKTKTKKLNINKAHENSEVEMEQSKATVQQNKQLQISTIENDNNSKNNSKNNQTCNLPKTLASNHLHSIPPSIISKSKTLTDTVENDEQIIKSLLCKEQMIAITPTSSSSSSSLQDISPKMKTNGATTNSNSSSSSSMPPRLNLAQRQLPPPPPPAPATLQQSREKNKIADPNSASTSSAATVAKPNTAQRRICRDNNIASALSMVSTFDMLNWKEDRLATARGTILRFELNEFNLLQIHERNCPPRLRIHAAYDRPIYERTFGLKNTPDHADPMLYMCRKCKTYGPAVDFLAPEFCSYNCLRRSGGKRAAVQRDNTNIETTDNFHSKRSRKSLTTNLPTTTQDLNKKTNINNYATTSPTKPQLPKFRWSSYLATMRNAYAAPIDLFLNPFPTGPNPFTVGMKLEAIDPENCSLFCVCTVVQIQGYRMRLHFDGYENVYDFWVNADSMDIFPPGWCQKTNRILQPPRNYHPNRFSWPEYLKKMNGMPADKKFFTHLNGSSVTNRNPFQVGMFLEADDLNDTGKLCVASVADVLDERIRVHFDGWDDCYDYWVDTNSPYIHPCGWHEGRQQLLVPPEYGNTSFNWREYINEANAGIAAPEEFFVTRDPIDYRPGMKLEVVDPRNPSLIRPATVVHHSRYRVKIIFDCWPSDYTFLLEDDSPDLHPIGWCDATDHELEPPPGYQQFKRIMPCSTPGCRGIGNMNRNNGNTHATRETCPYALENWRIKYDKTPRVEGKEIVRAYNKNAAPLRKNFNSQENVTTLKTTTTMKEESRKLTASPLDVLQFHCPIKYATRGRPRTVDRLAMVARQQELQTQEIKRHLIEPAQIKTERKSIDVIPVPVALSAAPQIKIEAVVSNGISAHKRLSTPSPPPLPLEPNVALVKRFLCDYGPRLQQNYTIWRENLFRCDIAEKVEKNPLLWNSEETSAFIYTMLSECCDEHVLSDILTKFQKHDIDGVALLMLQQQDLTEVLELKLGPVLKVHAIVLQLRILVASKYESHTNNNEDIKSNSFESENECSVK